MNASDFYKAFAERANISQEKAKELCNTVFDLLAASIEVNCIRHSDRIYIKGLGTFKCRTIKPHRVGNFYGDEPFVIPERKRVVFEFSPSCDAK